MAELLLRRQYEVQLLQGEQPMAEWTQGEQQMAELLLRRQYEVQLFQGEQPRTELFPRRQYEVQLLQEEQPMVEWTLREQYEVQQLQEEQLMEELLHGEQPVVPLNRKVPLNGALGGPLKEGEGTRLLLSLDHPLSCNRLTEIPARPPGGTSTLHPRRHPPPPSQENPSCNRLTETPRAPLAAPLFLTHADLPLLLHR
jgi:hypothetical protein